MIRNPEISAITETIMAALANPAEHTKAALDMLSSTAFVHSIDAPSLAIVAPVLRYSFVVFINCLISGLIDDG